VLGLPAKVAMPATAGMQAIAVMHAAAGIATTARTQATAGMKATTGPPVEAPTTVLAFAGIPTATVWSPTTHDFLGKFEKNLSERQKIHKKTQKRVKEAYF
jgi:hypothetical protein